MSAEHDSSAGDPWGHGAVVAHRYELRDLLADHAGARFWRATDRILARDVAVHLVPSADPRARAVLSAARASASVPDHHVLRVLDADEQDGAAYVVVEWGSGMSLDRILDDAPLPPRRAAWLVKQVAEAVSAAHAHGVAHGRLLPENVLVTESGTVKLIGFVIDGVLAGGQQPWGADEQVLSDHEADVLNLAALLYAALTGRWPGTDGSAVPAAPTEAGHVLRPRQVRAGVPRPLDALCQRVLRPDAVPGTVPVETAQEVAAALSDYVGDPTSLYRAEDAVAPERPAPAPDPEPEPASDATAVFPPPAPASDGMADGLSEEATEATQAGAPIFSAEHTGVGWVGADGREVTDGSEAWHEPRRDPAPPPPPLPEPEPRPLFAPDAPRRTRATAPLAAPEPVERDGLWPWAEPGDQTPPPAAPGRGWLRIAAAIAAVVALVVVTVIAFNLGADRGGDPDTPAPGADASPDTGRTLEPITVAGVRDLDPPPAGNGEENPERVGAVVDGDPSTTWITMEYFDQFPSLKPGVGLVLDLGEPTDVAEIDLDFVGEPTSFTLFASDAEPDSVDGLTAIAEDTAGAQARVELDEPVTTRYVVVWLTSIPPAGGRFRGEIAEIALRG